MLPSLLPSLGGDVRDQMVIAPHHPDRLRRPSACVGALEHERFQQTLVWNVFRTLELISPAFWLRRLHARLVGKSLPAAPHIVRVHLWLPLPAPPSRLLDGMQPEVVADVLIETEHTIWTLISGGRRWIEHEAGLGDPVARLVDAGAWRAGTRHHFFGVLESEATNTSVGTVLVDRYSRSTKSAGLRSGIRPGAAPDIGGVGVLQWADLTSILHECERAQIIAPIERALAGNALTWLQAVGIEPGGLPLE